MASSLDSAYYAFNERHVRFLLSRRALSSELIPLNTKPDATSLSDSDLKDIIVIAV
jgi:hypothetical protein